MIARTIPAIIIAAFLSCLATGCVSHQRPIVSFDGANQVTISYSDTNGFLYGHPGIEASINGVSGSLMIDTGTVAPLLSRQAVRLCGIVLSPSPNQWWDGQRMVSMEMATNVTVRLTPNFAIHWPEVAVLSTEDKRETNFFGFLDYGTLRAAHAVMDTNKKTITLSR